MTSEILTTIEKIRKKLARILYKTDIPSKNDAQVLYSTLVQSDDGQGYMWSDISYTDQTPSTWRATEHYNRILKILKGYGEKKLQDKEFVQRVFGAVNYWAKNDFKNPNWWHNDIGTPKAFGNIAVMMYDALEKEQRDIISALVSFGSAKVRAGDLVDVRDGVTYPWTGTNLIWIASNTIKHAILVNDEDELNMARELLGLELVAGKHEGVQEDGSFFMHGHLFYSGGYGRSFAYDMAVICYILGETKYQLPAEKLDLLLTHILDGLNYMTLGSHLDWQCVGREYVRPGGIGVKILKDVMNLMVRTPEFSRRNELSAYFGKLYTGDKCEYTKYFDKAHFLCHRSGGLYVSTKFSGQDLYTSEICNGENVLGKNLAYGTSTCIMRSGEEYADIAPLWNYSRIPGTTSRTESDEELLADNSWVTKKPQPDLFGGMQKGTSAVIYQRCEHDCIEELNCYFAFKGGFVCMGAGIKDISGRDEELVTTIDQTRLTGEMYEDDYSFYHNGICYRSLDGKKIHDHSPIVTGMWTRNNLYFPDKEPVSAEILTLEIHHEKGTESSYAYLICEEDNEPWVSVLCNDTDAQAILLPDGRVLAAFYNDCVLTLEDGRAVEGKKGIYIE